MAFFTEDFLNARRRELLRAVKSFQYQVNGREWHDGAINSKAVDGNAVVVFVNAPSSGEGDTITGVRVYDSKDRLAGGQRERGAAEICFSPGGSRGRQPIRGVTSDV